MSKTLQRQRLYDGVAIGLSVACLIHCLLLPAMLVLLPAMISFLSVPEEFHYVALVFAIPASVLALASGFRRHAWTVPTIVIVPGLALLSIGTTLAPGEWMERAFIVPGAVLLALGHTLNWRALRTASSQTGGRGMIRPVIPATFDDWKHCIAVLCRIPLTLGYVEARIAALEDPADYTTQRFVETWGTVHHERVVAWFRQARANLIATGAA